MRRAGLDSYWWLCFRTANETAEFDQDRLFEYGATGIEEVGDNAPPDPGVSPAEPADVVLKAFFDSVQSMDAARTGFRDRKDVSSGEEKSEDWDRSWRDRQTPVEVTPS